jgi:hypothetical protein
MPVEKVPCNKGLGCRPRPRTSGLSTVAGSWGLMVAELLALCTVSSNPGVGPAGGREGATTFATRPSQRTASLVDYPGGMISDQAFGPVSSRHKGNSKGQKGEASRDSPRSQVPGSLSKEMSGTWLARAARSPRSMRRPRGTMVKGNKTWRRGVRHRPRTQPSKRGPKAARLSRRSLQTRPRVGNGLKQLEAILGPSHAEVAAYRKRVRQKQGKGDDVGLTWSKVNEVGKHFGKESAAYQEMLAKMQEQLKQNGTASRLPSSWQAKRSTSRKWSSGPARPRRLSMRHRRS